MWGRSRDRCWVDGKSGPARGRAGRTEVGSGTVLAALIVILASSVAWCGVVGAGYVAAAHRARGTADLAAVSGAADEALAGDACRAAALIAGANGARTVACSVSGDALDFVVTVTVEVSVEAALPGLPRHLRATAHAGRLTEPE